MKKLALAFAFALFALTPSMANARQVTVGGSTVNVKNGKDYKQLELGYGSRLKAPVVGDVDYGINAELGDRIKTVGVSGGRELALGKATVTPSLEVGLGKRDVTKKITSGKKYTIVTNDEGYGFGGGALRVSYPVPLAPAGLSVNGGVRYRESFTDDVEFRETRLSGGIDYSLSPSRTLGLEARKTTGTVKSNGIALKFSQKF